MIMIDVRHVVKMLNDYGLTNYKNQKYLIIPQAVQSALLNNDLMRLRVRDVNTLCDILCCRPEDILRYEYEEETEQPEETGAD